MFSCWKSGRISAFIRENESKMDLKMTYKVSLSSPLLAFRVQKCHFLCPFSKLIRVFFPVLDVKSGYFCMFWVDNSIIIIDHLGPFSLLSKEMYYKNAK